MEYFVYCRDRPGTGGLREQLVEAHWSYMDGYSERMVARGPTLAEDGETATGSMHIVDLPDAEAARAFAFEEPNYAAGVYDEVTIRRWHNALGRTMWEFAGGAEGGPRFLVIGHRGTETATAADGLADFADEHRDSLILCGPLLSDDGSECIGAALAVEAPAREAVKALVAGDTLAGTGLCERVEIHRWQFGGRR